MQPYTFNQLDFYTQDRYAFRITENNTIFFEINGTINDFCIEKLFVSIDLGATWTLINDSSYILKYFATNDSLFYFTNGDSWQQGKYYRSLDGGLTSTEVIYPPNNYPVDFDSEESEDYSIVGKNNRLYASSNSIWIHDHYFNTHYSDDFGLTWNFSKSFDFIPKISLDSFYDFALIYGGEYYKRDSGSLSWTRLSNLKNSLASFHTQYSKRNIFTRNNSLYIYSKNNPFNGKDVLYKADNALNFAYPVFQSSLLNRMNVTFHEENNIVSFIPQVNSSFYYLYNDSVNGLVGLASGKVF